MSVRTVAKNIALSLFITGIMMTAGAVAGANGDFTLRVMMNGADVTESDTITIDPDEPLKVELRITNVTADVVLRDISVDLNIAGQTVFTETRALGQVSIAAGDSYTREIMIDLREFLKAGDMTLVTGIYGSRFRVTYSARGLESEWNARKNIKIPGNPITTPAGAAGAVVSLVALTSIVLLAKTLAAPAMAAAGPALPAGASVTGTPGLQDLILNKLESTTRGRVVGNIVKAAKSRIVKDKCPICESQFKHGQCLTCRKSVKEVRSEYTEKLKNLALEGGQLIASGQAQTFDDITSMLGISGKLGTDVIATLKHARLVKVGGLARKVMGKAITAGISSGISAIIWVTVGGFAVLSTGALAGILVAAVALPLIITKTLQAKTKKQIRQSPD